MARLCIANGRRPIGNSGQKQETKAINRVYILLAEFGFLKLVTAACLLFMENASYSNQSNCIVLVSLDNLRQCYFNLDSQKT